jgi:hypothetical protein
VLEDDWVFVLEDVEYEGRPLAGWATAADVANTKPRNATTMHAERETAGLLTART